MSSTKKNASLLFLSTLIGIATQLIQFVLMGRMLTIEEVGLASTVLIVVVFAQMFTDFGLSGYYVHRQDASVTEKSTLYWLNIGLGLLIAGIIALTSPLISYFFGYEQLTFLLLLTALSFPVIASGSQFQAVLLKSFNYKRIAFVEIVARLVGLIGFVLAIYSDLGALSIVIGHLCASTMKTILLFACVSADNYPKFMFNLEYAYGGLSYGGYLILGQACNQIGQNLDKVLIGKFLGMGNLGVYTLAKDLAMRAMQAVNPVINKLTLPRYAKHQHDQQALVQDVRFTLLIIGFLSSLIFFGLSMCSRVVVDLLYGPSKSDVIPILTIIPFYVMFRSFGNMTGTLLGALGKTKLDFKWNILAVLVTTPIVYLLCQSTTEYLATGMVLLQLLLTILSYFFLVKPVLKLNFYAYFFHVMAFPSVASIMYALTMYYDWQESEQQVLIRFFIWVTMYLLASFIIFQNLRKKVRIQ